MGFSIQDPEFCAHPTPRRSKLRRNSALRSEIEGNFRVTITILNFRVIFPSGHRAQRSADFPEFWIGRFSLEGVQSNLPHVM
jgi:hypothetical protein